MNITEKETISLFELAGFSIRGVIPIQNRYLPQNPAYAVARDQNPWFLVTTDHGQIIFGPRKRVFSIEWGLTDMRLLDVFKDDVTKTESMIHAWGKLKALEYLIQLKECFVDFDKGRAKDEEDDKVSDLKRLNFLEELRDKGDLKITFNQGYGGDITIDYAGRDEEHYVVQGGDVRESIDQMIELATNV